MKTIDEMKLDELRATLHDVSTVFGIGTAARSRSTIVTNCENASRRADCLSRVENCHTKTVIDEDTGEEYEETVLNWAHSPEQYDERYKSVLSK